MKNVIVVGGGAAGFFAAITCAEKNPDYHITILEKSKKLLAKVKVSGGGRCNVTHACFDVRELVKFYPRGNKQLIGAFTRFNPIHTIEWFRQRGVELKTEADGRMFPATDSSQTIIDCFLREAKANNINIQTGIGVEDIFQRNGKWHLKTTTGETLSCDAVIMATGSSEKIWSMLAKLGHTIVPPVASLFTFNIKDETLKGLQGIAVPDAVVSVPSLNLSASGALLITHWGLSGPAVLKLSAFGAREMAALQHHFGITVNWLGSKKSNEAVEAIKYYKEKHPKQQVSANALFNVPKRLWESLTAAVQSSSVTYANLSNKQIAQIAELLTSSSFVVKGKSIFKEEFVTAGGIDLNEVDFKTLQSKKFPALYFAGETLNIDAVTGGFNFQAAWTTGYLAGSSV
ncbi:MAG: NAD(P)/FAD-dependent oxidoreductase [Chitinophagales bacterium]|nr:NAD(P)/FAD-dependent oxidoreductase [Chitinophagales bacterium]